MCAVFVESKVVLLLHIDVEKDRIMMGVYETVVERVAVLAERVNPEPEVVLVGGMVKQPVFADVLGRKLRMEMKTPGLAWCAGANRCGAEVHQIGTLRAMPTSAPAARDNGGSRCRYDRIAAVTVPVTTPVTTLANHGPTI